MKLRKPPPPLPYETINDVSVAETEKRPFRLQFYTVISILVVTLGLIAVVVYLNKKLPDASHSRYDLPGVSRADISFAGDRETGQQEKAIRNAIVVVEEDVLARAAKAFRKRQIRFPPNEHFTDKRSRQHSRLNDSIKRSFYSAFKQRQLSHHVNSANQFGLGPSTTADVNCIIQLGIPVNRHTEQHSDHWLADDSGKRSRIDLTAGHGYTTRLYFLIKAVYDRAHVTSIHVFTVRNPLLA
ncbi:hypothetical protein EsH8_IX_000817 [Colletotrichum jinshuiense]